MLRILIALLGFVSLGAQEDIQFNILLIPQDTHYVLEYELNDRKNRAETLRTSEQDSFLFWMGEYLKNRPSGKKQVLFYVHGMWGSQRGNFNRVYRMLKRNYLDPEESDIAFIISLKWPGNDFEYRKNKSRIPEFTELLQTELTVLLRKLQLIQWWFLSGQSKTDLLVHSLGNELVRQWLRALDPQEYEVPLFQNAVFAASDLDYDTYTSDSLLNNVHQLAGHCHIYYSERDLTLEVSKNLNKKDRLGRVGPDNYEAFPDNTSFIDVTLVKDETNFPDLLTGHSYYRSSPLVTGDMLKAMMNDSNTSLDYRLEKDTGRNHFLISPKETN